MKKIRIKSFLFILIVNICLLPMDVHASDEENAVKIIQEEGQNAVNDARNGILQVNLVYIDEDNKSYVVHGGSGFLIGNEEGANYVITSNENITVTDELRNSVGKDHKIKKSERKNMQFAIRVVIKRDVVVEAVVTTYSEQVNFAVLQLSQTIYDRKPLKLEKNTEKVQEMETIYTLGFPEEIQNEQDVSYYTYEDVSVMNGIVSKKASIDGALYIQHSAVVTKGNSGGPIINQFGHVIGVNQVIVEDDYHYSVHISEVTAVLDALGIPYTEAVAEQTEEVVDTKPLQDALQAAMSFDSREYTKESVEQYNAVINQVSEVLSDEAVTEKDIENGLTMLATAKSMLIVKNNNYVFILIGAVIAGLLTVITILITWIIRKNSSKTEKEISVKKEKKTKKKKTKSTYEELVAIPPFQQAELKQETSVLSSAMGFDEGETTILDASMQQNGIVAELRRLKNNETISISKNVFYIGKDGLRTDYCIKGNPSVSRCHAVIKQIGEEFYLEDLQATNGTYHNDVALQPSQSVKLMSGDRIRLANEEFVFSV